ncbi:hypothetical protein MMC26_002329 [Xylographa opegraphella]|nr:hypothetical protein [Xylographa opegraphella]
MAPSSTATISRKPVATLLGPNPLQSQPPMDFASRPNSPMSTSTESDGGDKSSVDEPVKVDKIGGSFDFDQPYPLLDIEPRPIVSSMGNPPNDTQGKSSTTEPFPLFPYEMPDAHTIPLAYFIAALTRADYWRTHYLTMNNPHVPDNLPFKVIVIGTEKWEEHDFLHARHILGVEIVGPGVPPLKRHVRNYNPSEFIGAVPSGIIAEMAMAEADANFFDGTDPNVDYRARRAQISKIRWSHLRCQIFEDTPGDLQVEAQMAHIKDLQSKRAREYIQRQYTKEVHAVNARAELAAGVADRAKGPRASPSPAVLRRPAHAPASTAVSQVHKEPTATIVTGITRKGPNNTLTIRGADKQRLDNASVITKSSALSKSSLFMAASKTKAVFKKLSME